MDCACILPDHPPEMVHKRFLVPPSQVAEWLALVGDDDALPGVAGIGAKGAALPIVFLTGRGDIPMSVRALKQGAVDFLTKPVTQDALNAAVQSAIGKDREPEGRSG